MIPQFMRTCAIVSAVAAACTLTQRLYAQPVPSTAPCPQYTSPAIEAHIKKAYELAGHDFSPNLIPSLFLIPRMVGLCAPKMVADFQSDNSVATPTKAFDQLYYIGNGFVGSWALKTSAGIILFDAMNNSDDAQNIVEAGLRQLGLNPGEIKYIVITHGHADHWGGAKYFQDKFHSHVLMGAEDWKLAEAPPRSATFMGHPYPTPPAKDQNITDGQKLTLGETTVVLYLSPGHTPASMSAIFPVTDNGQPHVLALFGGTGIPPHVAPDTSSPQKDSGVLVYLESVRRLIKLGQAAGVDGAISTHPIFDGTIAKTSEIRSRKPGDANPWVLGKSKWVRYMEVDLEVAETIKAMESEHPVK